MAAADAECIFCRIAAGEVPSDIVHEDHWAVAFRDLNPRAPTHVLVVPRRHVPSIDELNDDDSELLGALFTAVRTVARREGLTGYRLVTNVGPEAGQSVFHLHLHLMGGRAMAWPPG